MIDSHTDMSMNVSRFARGELRGDALDAFEDYLMEHPELVEEVEAERLLVDAFQHEPTTQPPLASSNWYWPAAAGFLLAIGLSGVLSILQPAHSQGGVITAEIRLENMRSGSTVESIPPVASSSGLTLLLVDVGPDPAPAYCINLRRQDDSLVLHLDEVPSIDGYLQFTAADLNPGMFHVEIAATNCTTPTARYSFQVTPAI